MTDLFTIDCGEIFLREFSVEDVEAIYEITSQPEVYEYLPDWKSTREQRLDWVTNNEIPSNKRFLSAVPHIEEQNYLKLGIFLKETGEFIGFCTTGIKEELPEPNREVAYAVSTRYQKLGYATMAVNGLVRFLFEETNVEVLNAVVLRRNVGSSRVVEKCGFGLVGEVVIDGQVYDHFTFHKESVGGKV